MNFNYYRKITKKSPPYIKMSSFKIRVILEILLNSIVCFLQFSYFAIRDRLIIKVDLFSQFYGSLEFWIHLSPLSNSPLRTYMFNCFTWISLIQHSLQSLKSYIHIYNKYIFITFFKRFCLLNPVREFLILWRGTIVLNFTPRNICSCSKK